MQKNLFVFLAAMCFALPNAMAGEVKRTSFSDGVYIALSGMVSVFVGLAILMLAIWIIGKIMQRAASKRAAEEKKSAEQKM